MTSKEAAEVIRSVGAALIADPSQFHISVNVVGQQVTSSGGTGLQVTAVGGGPGSTTVGQVVSQDGAQVAIKQQRGARAMDQQLQALINSLNNIASELESSAPNRGTIERIYQSLLNTWVPGVITSVIGNLLCRTGWLSSTAQ
jgi:hypothetical protein